MNKHENLNVDEVEEETEEKKSPAEELKSEFIENAIILGLSAIVLLVAVIIKNNNVSRWLYTLSFVFAGYEILYSSIVKLCKKALIIEEISILASALILLYCNQSVLACLVVLFYCLSGVILKFVVYKTTATAEHLQNAASFESDKTLKERLDFRAQTLKLTLNERANAQKGIFGLYSGVAVIVVGLIIAFIPPIFGASYGSSLVEKWLPCGAAVVAFLQPAIMFTSKSICYLTAYLNADKNGIAYGSDEAIEYFAKIDSVAFDKSGVVTDKTITIERVESDDLRNVLSVIYAAENGINDEYRSAVSRYAKENSIETDDIAISNVEFIENRGLIVNCGDKKYAIGNKKLINETFGFNIDEISENSVIYFADESGIKGRLYLKTIIKPNIGGVINELSLDLNKKTVLLSSDNVLAVNKLKNELKFDKAIAGASTEYKAKYVRENAAIYVGDGEYDKKTLGLLESDCIVLGSNKVGELGASLENLDVREIPTAFKLASRTIRKIKKSKILSVVLRCVTAACVIILSIFAPQYLWIAAIVSLVFDISILTIATTNLSEIV